MDRWRLLMGLNVVNPGGSELLESSVALRLPAALSPTQRLVRVAASMDHELRADRFGNPLLLLRWPRIPPYGQAVVDVRTWIDLWPRPLPQVLASRRRWSMPEPFIEVEDAAVQALARRLRQPSEPGSARAIFDWVCGEVRYAGYLEEVLGAAYAARERRGDCSEFACLSVALARALGIPARVIGGHVIDGDAAPKPGEYHDWAEFHFDGAWQLVDAQKRYWLEAPVRHVRFTVFPDDSEHGAGGFRRFATTGGIQVRLV